jgi:cytochrome b6-f complex iron-sulfur subunit
MQIMSKQRRQFLHYLLGGGIGTLTIGLLFPRSSQGIDATTAEMCDAFPLNSRCKDVLPGFPALDQNNVPLVADQLLTTVKPGIPIPVKGLPKDELAYLVINEGPKIAEYGIRLVCTHLGCTVQWKAEQNQFVCPCHGSQFDNQGRVVKGPAKRSLPIASVVVKQNQIRLVDITPALDPR